MKKIIHILISLFFTFVTTLLAQGPAPDITTDLIAHYEFEGNTNNSIGISNDAIDANISYISGINAQAAMFDGKSSIKLPSLIDSSVSGITLSLWVKVSSTPQNDETIFYHGDGGEFALYYNNNGLIGFKVKQEQDGGQGEWVSVESTSAIPLDQFIHITAVYTKNSGLELWINADQNNTYSDQNIQIYDPGSDFTASIGATNNESDYFNGIVDDVKIYSRALTSTDIPELSTPKLMLEAHGGVLQFSGESGADVTTSIDMSSFNSYTIEGWFNLQEYGNYKNLFIQSDGTANSLKLGLGSNNNLEFIIANGKYVITNENSIDTNSWHHIAAVNNEGNLEVFVDGVSVGKSSVENVELSSYPLILMPDLKGMVDEFRIWNIARSSAEINATMHQQLNGKETGLVVYYNFDERVGSTIKDISGNSDAIIEGNVTRLNFLGDTLNFNGVDDKFVLGDVIDNQPSYSESVWVHPITLNNDYNTISRKNFISNLAITKVGKVSVNIGNGTAWGTECNSSGAISLDQWSHIAYTYSDALDEIKIYINGNLDKTCSGFNISMGNNTRLRTIGVASNGNNDENNDSYFNGFIKELSIWSKTLRQNEIQKNMSSSLEGNETELAGYWPLNEASGVIENASWVNTAPTIYGNMVYTSQNIYTITKIITQNITSQYAYSITSASVNIVNNSFLSYIHSTTENESATISEVPDNLSLNVDFVTYKAINVAPAISIDRTLSLNADSFFLGSFDTSGSAMGVALSDDGSIAYVADESNGLVIINISNLANPTSLGSFDTSGSAMEVVLSNDGTKAYIADGNNGLVIIDVTNPKNPTLLGNYSATDLATGVALSNDGTKAYIADHNNGLMIIDVSNSTNPTLIKSYNAVGEANKVILSSNNSKAYVTNGNDLVVVDISNTQSPTILVRYETIGDAYGIALANDGTKAYIADKDNGLVAIDIASLDYINKNIIPKLANLLERS